MSILEKRILTATIAQEYGTKLGVSPDLEGGTMKIVEKRILRAIMAQEYGMDELGILPDLEGRTLGLIQTGLSAIEEPTEAMLAAVSPGASPAEAWR